MKKRFHLRALRKDVNRSARPDYQRWFTHLYLDGQEEKRCTVANRCRACRVRFGLP